MTWIDLAICFVLLAVVAFIWLIMTGISSPSARREMGVSLSEDDFELIKEDWKNVK